jgi:hypothetical protein
MKKLFTKTILALAFLGIGINHTQAQYVTIQDNNFKSWLMQQYPSCFNASQEMDTTCSAVVNETSLTLPNWNTDTLTNIAAIQYFDNLHRIYIDNNNINATSTNSIVIAISNTINNSDITIRTVNSHDIIPNLTPDVASNNNFS